eukprot:TRINITY_DN78781_c0_g1_i1.p1 TRINITY_DN78781_c0_g1~~TRINITY_DN78781_c0_g1_i1.p1  ORF type:complete len:416 (+),score=15.13 TRINITY_DN78781_c0_g1_i1:215-1462(+)
MAQGHRRPSHLTAVVALTAGLLLASLAVVHCAEPQIIQLPSGSWSMSTIDTSDKNAGMASDVENEGRGYLHYMATANNKGMHLAQAVASIRAVNTTAAAAIQSAAALPADQQTNAQSDVYTTNMGQYLAYHGGKMMAEPEMLSIYVLWYGRWTRKQKRIIRNFIHSLDRKSNEYAKYPTVVGWWAINVRYYTNAVNKRATPYVKLEQELTDKYSFAPYGTVLNPLTHDHIRQLLTKAMNPKRKRHFPVNPNAAYIVLTAPDVYVTDFCKGLCAYHTSATFYNQKLAYAFVGNAATQCARYCTYQYFDPTFSGANGDLGADAVVDKIGHELSELATNPFHGPDDKPGWVVAKSQIENADLCEWRYGMTNYEPGGKIWNVKGVNGTKYLLQLNFNVRKRECALQGDDSVVPGILPSP